MDGLSPSISVALKTRQATAPNTGTSHTRASWAARRERGISASPMSLAEATKLSINQPAMRVIHIQRIHSPYISVMEIIGYPSCLSAWRILG
jgi:hypothetical protein